MAGAATAERRSVATFCRPRSDLRREVPTLRPTHHFSLSAAGCSQMGCSSSSPAQWEIDARSTFEPLRMRSIWMTDRCSASARVELTVTSDGVNLLTLDGGFVHADGGQCHPSDAVITSATGEKWRAICKPAGSHDTWSWCLQSSRTQDANGNDLECSVCMCPFYQPVRFPAHPDTKCEHIFCRECLVRCLSTEQTICPLCRAPLAEGMTALKAKRLPIDESVEAEFAVPFACKPISINFVSPSPSTSWKAPGERHEEGSALPAAISVQPYEGRTLAWKGSSPPSKSTKLASLGEEEQAALLGFAATSVRNETRPGSCICIREVDVGVDRSLMRKASRADQAIFLAMLTETFWSRGGHGNVHIAQNPWGGPRMK